MIHIDAHTDLFDEYFGGSKFTHGTPFRRAIEEGLLDPNIYQSRFLANFLFAGPCMMVKILNGEGRMAFTSSP